MGINEVSDIDMDEDFLNYEKREMINTEQEMQQKYADLNNTYITHYVHSNNSNI